MGKEVLEARNKQWEQTFTEKPDMFRVEASDSARKSMGVRFYRG